jgi:hypothetical protein
MKTMYYKFVSWLKWNAKHLHRDIAQGFRNLRKWLPVIWRDRDWDSHYIYEVLKHKIQKQADYMQRADRYVGIERDVEIMRLVCRLIERQQDETYGAEYIDYHETRYEFVPATDNPNVYTMESITISENFDEYFAKYPRQYKQAIAGQINRFGNDAAEKTSQTIAMEIAYENQERCHALLFKLLESNIRKWWD